MESDPRGFFRTVVAFATIALVYAVTAVAQPATQPGGVSRTPATTAQTQPSRMAGAGEIAPCCAGMMAMMPAGGDGGTGGPMRGMGGGAMGGAGDGQPQYSCCPPSALSMMIQGPMRWLPMLLGGLLLLSVIAVLLALAVFFIRRSRVGVPARA